MKKKPIKFEVCKSYRNINFPDGKYKIYIISIIPQDENGNNDLIAFKYFVKSWKLWFFKIEPFWAICLYNGWDGSLLNEK